MVAWQRVKEALKRFQICTWESKLRPRYSGVLAAQLLDHLNGVKEVVVSITTSDSEIFAVVLSPVAKQPSLTAILYACVQRYAIFHTEIKYFGREWPALHGRAWH